MGQPLPRRGRLPRQQVIEEGRIEQGDHPMSTCGCFPVKIRVAARFLGARVSVVVEISRRSTQPSGQSGPTGANRLSVN
nr:hypothetical protein [Dromedary astrovirus]